MNHSDKKAIQIALIPVFFWSTVSTAFKFGLKVYFPSQLIFLASIVSFVVFLVSILLKAPLRQQLKPSPKLLLHAAITGLFTPFLYYLILFKAYSLLPAQLAQPLNMIWPLVLTLLSVPVLKQRIGRKSFVALLISFIGIVILSAKGNFSSFADTNFKGVVLALISSVLWSVYWLFNRKSKFESLVVLFYSFGFAVLYLFGFLFYTRELAFELNSNLIWPIYVGLFEVGISFILWGKAMALTSNNAKIANFIYLAPFVALIFIHFFLGETIFYTTYIGLIFIVSGILLQQTDQKLKSE